MSWRAAMTALVPSGRRAEEVGGEVMGRTREVAGEVVVEVVGEVVGAATDLGHVSQEPLGGDMGKKVVSFST